MLASIGSNQNMNYKPVFCANLRTYSDYVRFAITDAYHAKFGEKSLDTFNSKGFIKELSGLFSDSTQFADGEVVLLANQSLLNLAQHLKTNIILLNDKEGLKALNEAENGIKTNKNLIGVIYNAKNGKRIPSVELIDSEKLIGEDGKPLIQGIIDGINNNYNKLLEKLNISAGNEDMFKSIEIPEENIFANYNANSI